MAAVRGSREALPSCLISCMYSSTQTIQLLWLRLEDEQKMEEEDEGFFYAQGSS